MEKMIKFKRELVSIVDRLEELKRKYPMEAALACACEYPPDLKALLSASGNLSETMWPHRKSWFLLDKDGWQIKLSKGRWLRNALRILAHNIRKIAW
jgi:hypothetical protein